MSSGSQTTSSAKAKDNRVAPPSVMRRYGSQIGIIGVGLAMWLGFVIAAPTVFLDIDIYKAFAQTTPLFGIIALALTFVVITGEIDLSFPSIMALGTAMFCLMSKAGVPDYLALLIGFATGALCGWINGALIARLNIPSLVITIGTSFLYRGTELILMNGTGVPLTEDNYPLGHLLFNSAPFGFPVQSIWCIVIAGLLWLLLNRTRFGAHVFLVGDNPTSARLMGIDVVRVKPALHACRRRCRLCRIDDVICSASISGRQPVTDSCSTRLPRSSWAAHQCSAARAVSSAPSSPPISSARSMPASYQQASTPSIRSSASAL